VLKAVAAFARKKTAHRSIHCYMFYLTKCCLFYSVSICAIAL